MLTCDFAEYYHIIEWQALPVATQAALAYGLPADSRSKRRITGQKHPNNTLMLALILDVVKIIAWRQTVDGMQGKNPPPSMYEALTGTERKEPDRNYMVFESGEDFEAARNEILRRGGFTDV